MRILGGFLIPKKRAVPSGGSRDHPEMTGAEEALESGGFAKETEGTLRPLASHGLLHYVYRGSLPKSPAAAISTRLRTGQEEIQERSRGPGCSVCHHVSWEGGGISNPPGPGQLPGPGCSPAWQHHSPSHHPL